METWHDVGPLASLSEEAPVRALAGGIAVALFQLDREVFALRDLCTHGHALLSDGYIEDGCVECPLHQGLFDIRTGAPRCAPVTEAVRSFPVRVVAGRVEVSTSDDVPQEADAPSRMDARVTQVLRTTHDVAVLRLAADPGFAYRAGQYLNIVLPDGHKRSYSMAALPAPDGVLEFHIRHLPGGLFTGRVFGDLAAGDVLGLEGPGGDFYLRDSQAPVVLLASGTGFAPIKALVEGAIASGNRRPMSLYWGGRRPHDLYMDALCRQWAASVPWLRYVPVLSEPLAIDAWPGRTGFVHRAVLDDHPSLADHEVYACGVPAMVEAARQDFQTSRALPASAFFADAFVSLADTARAARAPAA